jgi:hypothetical protein
VAYNFQIGNNKINLLKEYESVTQKVLLPVESTLENAKKTSTCAPLVALSSFILFFPV